MEWLHPLFQRDGNRETSNQKTSKFAVWTTHDEKAAQHYSALFFCFYVNDWTLQGLQHEGKKKLY